MHSRPQVTCWSVLPCCDIVCIVYLKLVKPKQGLLWLCIGIYRFYEGRGNINFIARDTVSYLSRVSERTSDKWYPHESDKFKYHAVLNVITCLSHICAFIRVWIEQMSLKATIFTTSKSSSVLCISLRNFLKSSATWPKVFFEFSFLQLKQITSTQT